jgi:hypothetical protein
MRLERTTKHARILLLQNTNENKQPSFAVTGCTASRVAAARPLLQELNSHLHLFLAAFNVFDTGTGFALPLFCNCLLLLLNAIHAQSGSLRHFIKAPSTDAVRRFAVAVSSYGHTSA